MNILFICSRNEWRSPTAEKIYQDYSGIHVRSAGTEPSARIKLTAKNINWADMIFVMEKKHKQRMFEKFPYETADKKIIVLNIPDDYRFMDPGLIEELKNGIDPYIDQ